MFNQNGFPFSFNRGTQATFKDISVNISAESSIYSKIKEGVINPFNRFGFNKPSTKMYKSFDYNADMTLHADLEGSGALSVWYERGIPFDAHMSGKSIIEGNYIRERLFKANLNGIANMYANFNRYTIHKFEYTGDVLPGDMVVVDMDRMTVTNNTHNALKYFDGDFFELAPSHNELIYSDGEQSRNVILLTRYKDRWL